jgi:predicted RNA-binding protein
MENKQELKEKIIKKVNRHIARTLSQLDFAGIDSSIKAHVKTGFWNACDDILEILEIDASPIPVK